MNLTRVLCAAAALSTVSPSQWVQVPAYGPGSRDDAMLAPMPALNGVVLFGGMTAAFTQGDQTWLFDGRVRLHAVGFDEASMEPLGLRVEIGHGESAFLIQLHRHPRYLRSELTNSAAGPEKWHGVRMMGTS
ncbi:MAG: hypothetical protein H6835_16850 [Planctomycetes bacterium]|nr:hypothetical protein [Planctomycetota bacterium]